MAGDRAPSAVESSRPTERVNPRTGDLDRLATRDVLARIIDEDAVVPAAVRATVPELERAVEILHGVLAGEGRWFSLGAGTSGRVAVIDAAEIPPTFGMSPDRVQAILVGGTEALTRSVEGAEDDADAARAELAARGFNRGDALVALSASGHTGAVLGGVAHAAALGAPTIGITCGPDSPLARAVDVPIVLAVGPEAIAGSTRMKGGLAQKMVLHALSTTVMVRLGRVRGNRMSEVRPVNAKLRSRAVRILVDLAGLSEAEAEAALDGADGSVPRALDRLGS